MYVHVHTDMYMDFVLYMLGHETALQQNITHQHVPIT